MFFITFLFSLPFLLALPLAPPNFSQFSLAEGELSEILSAFESSQCQTIPSKLLEYQMFNQPYYTGRLLRVLLAPRQVREGGREREGGKGREGGKEGKEGGREGGRKYK